MKFERTLTSNWENAFHGLRNPMNSWGKSDSLFGLAEHEGYVEDSISGIADKWVYQEEKENGIEYSAEDCDDRIEYFYSFLLKNGNIRYGDGYAFEYAYLGPNDMNLAQRMIAGGRPNDKFLRQIFVSVDITAPLYWWKEMDQYKIGTVTNSTSTMHKLASTPITLDCFEMDDCCPVLKLYDREPWNVDDYVSDMWESVVDYCETLRQRYNETKDIHYWKELIRVLPEGWLQTRTWTANYDVLRSIYHWRKDHKLQEWHQFCDWIKELPYAHELILYKNE